MKKNLFSDNKKGSKGFYAALGLSALMIGTACYFAYDEGEKLSEEFLAQNSSGYSEAAVDRRINGVPKPTAPAVTAAPAATAPSATAPAATLPAAAINTDELHSEIVASTPDTSPEALNAGITKMENVKAPLSDISNIIEPFSGSELVKSQTTGSWQTHNGTDIAAEVGSEVYVVSNGEVMEINSDPVWGVTVLVDHHNGFKTKYCSLSDDLAVQCGDMLTSGSLIGTVGNTADIESALPPHLHIEVLHNGAYIDPLSAIK